MEPDADLVVAAVAGDREAFTALYHRHRGAVTGFLTRAVGDPHLAEDLAQDAFVTALRTLKTLRSPRASGPGCSPSPTAPRSTTSAAAPRSRSASCRSRRRPRSPRTRPRPRASRRAWCGRPRRAWSPVSSRSSS
ncbi:RNA polymerase sigma factor [Actinokineospora soli]|uniref:RNA polymerase sigma factor n=1 Tax=Actinokineospora soli TaxID=1048753 RepID=A0ABW2TMM6_9PSEU